MNGPRTSPRKRITLPLPQSLSKDIKKDKDRIASQLASQHTESQSSCTFLHPLDDSRDKSDGSPLKTLIRKVIKQLLKAELPQWFKEGPTDATAREAAKWVAGKNFRDWSNLAGSALLLAMLQPDVFGIVGVPSLSQAFLSDREWHLKVLTFISPNKQRSSRGINNRRTNIIEGLLNDLATLPSCSRLHGNLHRAWQLMSRALLLVDPDHKLTHIDQVHQALSVSKPLDDDHWWKNIEQFLIDQWAQRARQFARERVLKNNTSLSQSHDSNSEQSKSTREKTEIDSGVKANDANTRSCEGRGLVYDGGQTTLAITCPLLELPCLRLPGVIAYANLLILSAKLPQWFLAGPSSSSLKQASHGEDLFKVPGWTHSVASAVLLAMLEPKKYGIPAESLFFALDAAERDWYLERWTAVSKSKNSGHNASRTTLLKGLFKYFSEDQCHGEVLATLRRSLELMIRGFKAVDPYFELDHSERVRRVLACTEALEDDREWSKKEQQLEKIRRQAWYAEYDAWHSEECDCLFDIMLPRLRSFAEQYGPGKPITGLTYSIMRSWLPGEGFSSTKRGASSMLKRLWVKAEKTLVEWEDEMRDPLLKYVRGLKFKQKEHGLAECRKRKRIKLETDPTAAKKLRKPAEHIAIEFASAADVADTRERETADHAQAKKLKKVAKRAARKILTITDMEPFREKVQKPVKTAGLVTADVLDRVVAKRRRKVSNNHVARGPAAPDKLKQIACAKVQRQREVAKRAAGEASALQVRKKSKKKRRLEMLEQAWRSIMLRKKCSKHRRGIGSRGNQDGQPIDQHRVDGFQ